MNRSPIKLLTVSYGIALVWAVWGGAPVWGAILGFWIGGAALALGLAMVPGVAGVLGVAPARPAVDAAAAELALWEEDLARETTDEDRPTATAPPEQVDVPRLKAFG